jgi:aryl-alcohol dehydrogenase-like predicted oxidoreductase
MTERFLGKSGLKISLAGLGANNFGQRISDEAARKVIHAALDHGVTFIDTADVYGGRGGSERIIGETLGPRRKDVVLATKFGFPTDAEGRRQGGSRRHIIHAVEASLARLKTDWIDLYQFHRPDQETPIDETLRALDDLVRSGKVRYIGISNFPAWRVVDAAWTAKSLGLEPIVSAQDEYSLVNRSAQKELIPALVAHGVGLLPYFPLAGGLLTGKYRRGEPPPQGARFATTPQAYERFATDANFDLLEKLTAFARERGHTIADLAFAWLAAQPIVASVIAGATSAEQVAANVKSLQWSLTTQDLADLEAILPPA